MKSVLGSPLQIFSRSDPRSADPDPCASVESTMEVALIRAPMIVARGADRSIDLPRQHMSNVRTPSRASKSLSAEIVFARNRRQYGYQALTNEQTRWR